MVKRLYVKRIIKIIMKRTERIDRVELMRTFARIVESGSLSAAARQLGTTQATVSRRLQSLETLLGVRLLLRTTHATKLTDDGERCYQHARKVIDSWLALEDEVGQSEDEPVGTLRVRAPHAFGQEQLLAPLSQFLMRYPQLSVDWMLYDRSADFLSDNIDCAIRVGAEIDPNTVSVLLAEVPRCVVAAPELLSRHAMPEVPDDLTALPWIALNTFYHQHIELFDGASPQPARVAISPRLSTDSLYVTRTMALNGLGVAVVSSWTVEQDIREGRLVPLLPGWQPAALPVHLVYPWSRYYPARLRRFLEMMREVMPQIVGMRKPLP
ncbi:LysR family transcriptional regulator [Lelliottia sp. 489]|uniref:LysR family transcriptional regulator n=1 Tax=Lelliottia sp. 489 TaxID=3156448 RepID=UPI003D192D4E